MRPPVSSVLDLRCILPLQRIETLPHGLQLLPRVTDPIDEFAHDAQRLAAAEGLRRVPGELLVSDVGVVFESACRLDDVYPPAPLTRSELGAPDRGVEGCSEVHVVHHPVLLEVRLPARHQHLAHCEVRLRAVQVDTGSVDLEGHRLTRRAHAPTIVADTGRTGLPPVWLTWADPSASFWAGMGASPGSSSGQEPVPVVDPLREASRISAELLVVSHLACEGARERSARATWPQDIPAWMTAKATRTVKSSQYPKLTTIQPTARGKARMAAMNTRPAMGRTLGRTASADVFTACAWTAGGANPYPRPSGPASCPSLVWCSWRPSWPFPLRWAGWWSTSGTGCSSRSWSPSRSSRPECPGARSRALIAREHPRRRGDLRPAALRKCEKLPARDRRPERVPDRNCCPAMRPFRPRMTRTGLPKSTKPGADPCAPCRQLLSAHERDE